MIVWLASYPRSGNTFLRAALHGLYGVPTYSVYDDDDPVAQRIGPALVGYRPKPSNRAAMAADERLYFVKTHKRCKRDGQRAIYLVRDGRDAVVSHARLRAAIDPPRSPPATFDEALRAEITRPYVDGQPSSGTWGGNVLSWLDASGPVAVLRFEQLIVDPRAALDTALHALGVFLPAAGGAQVPSFGDLHAADPVFFRRGATESYRDEMSRELQALFWQQPENADAMSRLGYGSGERVVVAAVNPR